MLDRRQQSFEIEAWKLQRTGTFYTPLFKEFSIEGAVVPGLLLCSK